MSDEKKQSKWSGLSVLSALFNGVPGAVQFWWPFLTSLASGAVSHFLNVPWYVQLGVPALVLLLIFLLFRKWRHLLFLRLLSLLHRQVSPQKPWEHRNKVFEYTYHDREHMTFQVRYSVKFRSGSHTSVPDRCKWTAGNVRVSPLEQGQSITMIPEDKKGDVQAQLGYQDFLIELPHAYTRRDPPLPIGYICEDLYDPHHKAMTCLIAGSPRKTDQITLRVRFHRTLRVTHIRKLKYADYLDDEPYEREDGRLELEEHSDYHYVEFVIRHPIIGGKYAIDWEFES